MAASSAKGSRLLLEDTAGARVIAKLDKNAGKRAAYPLRRLVSAIYAMNAKAEVIAVFWSPRA